MTNSEAQFAEKRIYLNKSKRKTQLINSGAELVEKQGWSALNMSTLADYAGVSRQLVYHYFPNLSSLLSAVAESIFADTMTGTVQALTNNPDNPKQAILEAAEVSLNLSKGRGDALWQLISGLNLGLPELEMIRVHIRKIVIEIWKTRAAAYLNISEEKAVPLVWMNIMAFWGARNLMSDGIITREQCLEEINNFTEKIYTRQK